MQKYSKPIVFSETSLETSIVSAQYFLDGQQMVLISGHDFCAQAVDGNAFELCLSGTENIASQLAGLTVSSTENGNHTILSCTEQPLPECSGTYYICTLTENGFEGPQCIPSIFDAQGNSISCDSSTCNPDA